MVGIQEIPRTAAFAWSPDASSTVVATGTKSGAVDEGFSNDTQLELWNLGIDKAVGIAAVVAVRPRARHGHEPRWRGSATTNLTAVGFTRMQRPKMPMAMASRLLIPFERES